MNKKILANRSLLTIGFSESVSNVGNWITMMAVFAMVVFKGDGTVAQSSGIFLAGLVPTLFASPLAGWLLDRYDRKWLMVASELTSGLITAGLIFTRQLELIYVVLALQAVSISLMTPARQAVIPDIVAQEDLTSANALLQQLAGIIKIAAPILAGLILAVLNPHAAIILDVVSFAISAFILSRLPSLPPHLEEEQVEAQGTAVPSRPRTKLVSVLLQNAFLRLLFVSTFLGVFIFIGFDVLSPLYTRDILSAGEGFFGTMIGLVGFGTVGATLALMLRKGNGNPWRDVILGLLMLAVVPATLALVTEIQSPQLGRLLIVAGCLIGGFGNGMLNVQVVTLIQLLTPAHLLGRLGGAFQSTAVAGQLAGLLVTPLLVPALLNYGNYFVVSTLAVVLVAIFIVFNLALSQRPRVGQATTE
ncbi:MAG: MFS transporter [Anaerolineales bacterium]